MERQKSTTPPLPGVLDPQLWGGQLRGGGKTPQISDPRVRFWDADFRPPDGGGHLFGLPAMQNEGKWLKNRGGHLLGRSFRAPPGGSVIWTRVRFRTGSLIRGGLLHVHCNFYEGT